MRIKLTLGGEDLAAGIPPERPITVAWVLNSLKDSRPDIHKLWCDQEGALRGSLLVFVNGEHIRYHNGLETELEEGDEIYVIPQISGG